TSWRKATRLSASRIASDSLWVPRISCARLSTSGSRKTFFLTSLAIQCTPRSDVYFEQIYVYTPQWSRWYGIGGVSRHQSALTGLARRGILGYEQYLFRARVDSDVVRHQHNSYPYCRGLTMDVSA